MRYLRDARFARGREALLGAEDQSITQVAMRWGFYHLGRFAVDYRKRFGETPSGPGARRRQPARAGPESGYRFERPCSRNKSARV
jgi:AraC-like DNA-binding protein